MAVGDRVTASLSSGRVVHDGLDRCLDARDGVRLQVDYCHEETALVEMWQCGQKSEELVLH